MESFKEIKGYLKKNYQSHAERSDLYSYFIEKGHGVLRDGGRFGFIVSNKFLKANYGLGLRQVLDQEAIISEIVDFAGLPVFPTATVRTIVLLTMKGKETDDRPYSFTYYPPMDADAFSLLNSSQHGLSEWLDKDRKVVVSSIDLKKPVWHFGDDATRGILEQLSQGSVDLDTYTEGKLGMGIKSGSMDAFVIDRPTRDAILSVNPEADEIIKPFLIGRDIRRYHIRENEKYLIYTYHGVPIKRYPAVVAHLKPFKEKLQTRATKQEWYELQQPQYKYVPYLEQPKLIFPDIAIRPQFSLDLDGRFCANTVYFIPGDDLYLLALLNSSMGHLYFQTACAGLEGQNQTYLRFFGQYLKGFPVYEIDPSNPDDVAKHDRMVGLVERMLDLHRRLPAAATDHEKNLIERQIEVTDRQIDALIYELYGLTDEEIRIVEGQGS